jgi:hypothetical protein
VGWVARFITTAPDPPNTSTKCLHGGNNGSSQSSWENLPPYHANAEIRFWASPTVIASGFQLRRGLLGSSSSFPSLRCLACLLRNSTVGVRT